MTIDAEHRAPPDRGIRYFIAHQNRWSWATLGLGIATLVMIVLGTILVLNAHGWTQECPEGVQVLECSSTDPLVEGITSNGLWMVIRLSLALAALTGLATFVSSRRYGNKPSKEATIAGAVLAVQGLSLAIFLVWFRGSSVDRFARNFLDIQLLGEKIGLVWSEISGGFGAVAKAAVPWALGMALGGLLIWIVWRMLTTDRPFIEPVRTMVLTGGALVLLGLILDLAGVVTTNLAWLRITDRLGDIQWSSVFPVTDDAGTVDGALHGLASMARFAVLWLGYGAIIGLAYRVVRRLWAPPTDERLQTPVRAVLILASSGFVIGLVKGFVATARLPSFSAGAWNTLILSIAGAIIGFGGGLLISLFTMSKRAVVRAPARIYINFFRGTPLIWQISFAGIGVVPALRLNISPYWIAILVLGLNLAAYSAEVYRAGIQSIERGQMEASRTLGLSYLQSLQYVIVPQAIRRVIPPLLNEFVILIKDTSLVSVLGLALHQKELLGVGRTIYSNTFNATAWLGAAAGFLIITLPMIRIVTIVERRMRSGLTSVI